MADPRPETVLDWQGPLSPPRRNGEITFESLWESRLFGMTMALYEAGAFRWEEFRDRLIEAIGAWERAHPHGDGEYRYWDCWLEAFERLVADKNVCTAGALGARVEALAARPAGHDH
jgi:nitrile hydratase accessory protein